MTTEYIKMVLALPEEFFDGWEWQAGDRAILLDDHYKREVLVINTHSQIVSSRIAKLLFPGSLEGCKTEEHITRLRPIPSQEQLIKKIIADHKRPNGDNIEEYYLLHEFYYFVKNIIPSHFEKRTWIEILLEFYMLRVNQKEWNGDSWI